MAKLRFKDRKNNKCDSKKSELPWFLKHAPKDLKDVAMHHLKLQEISNLIAPNSNTRVLILSGPAGSSKSTAVKQIAESRNQKVVEYHAPEALVGTTTLTNSFYEFMLGAAVFNREDTVILIEELPSLFHEETRQKFENSLISWSYEESQPVVVVCLTEIEVSAKYSEAIVVPRVLSELVTQSNVVWLKSNPVNATLLQRKLKLIVQSEQYDVPQPVIRILSQCGDIRSAINGLEFYCRCPPSEQRSNGDDLWIRGTPVELFYAIGKVIWTSSKKGSLEESINMFEDTMDTFNLTVLENYTSAKHQRLPVSSAASITEWLSIADSCKVNVSLGALGAANVIDHSETCENMPKKFVQTKFTQYPKWQTLRFAEQAKVINSLRNSQSAVTGQTMILEDRAFGKYFTRQTPQVIDSDSDSDF